MIDSSPQQRNKAKVKAKENKKYPYRHCRHCGKILINNKNGK
jgi:hypothetical protein